MDTNIGSINNRYSQDKRNNKIAWIRDIAGAIIGVATIIILANVLPA